MKNKTTAFVKRYCTMIRIGNQGRLTPESIALEKLLDKLIIRDRNRDEHRVSRPFARDCKECGVDRDPEAVSGMCERCETASWS
jgi:hypothetical protein